MACKQMKRHPTFVVPRKVPTKTAVREYDTFNRMGEKKILSRASKDVDRYSSAAVNVYNHIGKSFGGLSYS